MEFQTFVSSEYFKECKSIWNELKKYYKEMCNPKSYYFDVNVSNTLNQFFKNKKKFTEMKIFSKYKSDKKYYEHLANHIKKRIEISIKLRRQVSKK